MFHQAVLPALCKICTDRSAAVRVHLARSVGAWLLKGVYSRKPERAAESQESTASFKTHRAKPMLEVDLLVLLLDVLADDTFFVAVRAVAELNALGSHWQVQSSMASDWCLAELSSSPVPSRTRHDFACNVACLVSSSAARLVTLHFQQILNIHLARASFWKLQAFRIPRALGVLTSIARISVNVLPTQLPKLLILYCNSLDTCLEDRTAQDGSYAAIRALGANLKDYAPIFDTLSWLQAKERPAGAITCSAARQNGIVGVLSTFLGRANASYTSPHAGMIVNTLSWYAERNAEGRAKSLAKADSSDTADVLFCCAVGNLLSLKPMLQKASHARLIHGLLLSPSFRAVFLPPSKRPDNYVVTQSMRLLLNECALPSATELIEHYFDTILDLLPRANPCYEIQSGSWLLLSVLVHACPRAAARAFDESVAPILLVHLNPLINRNPEARIHALSLVHVLVCAPDTPKLFSDLSTRTLIEGVTFMLLQHEICQFIGAVVPNLVWAAGRTANTTRKAALAVLHGLVQGGALLSCTNYAQLMSKLYPILGTNVQEYDTSSREISLSCLNGIFDLLPSASLQEHEFNVLYPVIMKRLDDSSDNIRLNVCSTFSACV